MKFDDFVNDVKTFFDSIRNIGICAALTLGLPFVEKTTPLILGGSSLKFIVTSMTIGVISGLYLFNLVWLFCTLKTETRSKSLYIFSSIIVISLISLAIASTAFTQVFGELYNYA